MKTLLLALLLVLESGIANAEILSATFTPVAVPYQVNLSGSTAYALWGTGTNNSTEANLYGGPETLISNALQLMGPGEVNGLGVYDSPYFNYTVSGTQASGVLEYSALNIGSEAKFHFNPDTDPTTYNVWLFASGGSFSMTLWDAANEDFQQIGTLEDGVYGYASFTAKNPLDHLVFTLAVAGEPSLPLPSLRLGGVTAQVAAVPEPGYLIPLLLLVGGFIAYRIVELVWWLQDTLRSIEDEGPNAR
jgi:hypothetical protein